MTPAPSLPASSELFPAPAPAAPAPRFSADSGGGNAFARLIHPPAAGPAGGPARDVRKPAEAGTRSGDTDETAAPSTGRVLRLSRHALEAAAWAEGAEVTGEVEDQIPGDSPTAKEASRDETEAMLGAWGLVQGPVAQETGVEVASEEAESEVDADDAGHGEDRALPEATEEAGRKAPPQSLPKPPTGFAEQPAETGEHPVEQAASPAAPEDTAKVSAEGWRHSLAKARRAADARTPDLDEDTPAGLAPEGTALEDDLTLRRPRTRPDAGEGHSGDSDPENRGSDRRQEKNAAVSTSAAGGVPLDQKWRIKDIQSNVVKALKEEQPTAGIDVAQPVAAMPTQTSTPAFAADLSGGVQSPALPGGAVVVGRESGSVLQPEAAAARLVAAVVEVVESQVDARLAQAPSVSLKVNVGTEDVAIRVRVRDGAVHTEFRTESSELRRALQQEWAAVRLEPAAGGIRFLEPEFSGNGFGSGQGWTGGGEGQGRPAHGQPEPAAFARTLASAGADTAERAVAPRPAGSPTVHHASRHLSAVA